MLSEDKQARNRQAKRSMRVRSGVVAQGKLRLCVTRSLKHIYAQIIDDQNSVTIVGVGSFDKDIKDIKERKEAAKQVGLKLAKLAKEKQVGEVVFDRGRYKFHGRLASLADGAREGGLSF